MNEAHKTPSVDEVHEELPRQKHNLHVRWVPSDAAVSLAIVFGFGLSIVSVVVAVLTLIFIR